MNLFGIAITYVVCWWLVLFMVLPWGVRMAETPGLGHAPSAPIRHHLARKFLITTLLAILPTILFYFIITNAIADAKAKEPAIYSTSGGGGSVYKTKHAGEGCKPATLPNSSAQVPVDINVPISPYVDSSAQGSHGNTTNVDAQGGIGLGHGQVNSDGSLTMNGQRVGAPNTVGDCPPEASE